MDFLRYAIVYGDNGHFAIGLSVDDSDPELTHLVRRADGFDRACHAIPQVRDWISQAEPLTPVMGFGGIRNRWFGSTHRGQPLALGLLHAGDSARETNPFYGKGCSAALVSAHLVADALLTTRDPAERGRLYARRMHAELHPYHELAIATDRMFRARAQAARGARVPLAYRIIGQFYVTFAVPAAFEDAQVARTLLGLQHMRRPYSMRAKLNLIGRMVYLALRRLPKRAGVAPLALPQRSQFVALSPEIQVGGDASAPRSTPTHADTTNS